MLIPPEPKKFGTSNAFISVKSFLVLWVLLAWICASPCFSASTDSSTIDLRGDCGAVGDGKADDAQALRNCLDRLNRDVGPAPKTLFIPGGTYRITGSAGAMPTMNRGTTIRGLSPQASIIILDTDFAGDLFSWSEAWSKDAYTSKGLNSAKDASGPTVTGLKIVGSGVAGKRQGAIAFYDRNDFVLLRDIEMDYIGGPCLAIGRARHVAQAYTRESSFYNIKCWSSGSPTEPAVEIGSTTEANSDATNELDFFKLAIFDARGTGIAIRNPNRFSATRKIRFFGLRVEKSAGDGLEIAPEGDEGQVAELQFYDLSALSSGRAALSIGGAAAAIQPYGISVHGGEFGPGNAVGIEIKSGRLIDLDLSSLDAPIVLGASVGDDIHVHGNGSEYTWRFEGTKPPGSEAVPLNLRANYGLYGLPNAGQKVGAAALQARAQQGQPVRLTMDGNPPNAYNCFNPSYAQTFNLSIQLMAQSRSKSERWYAWTMPQAVFSALTGPNSAFVSAGAPMVRGANGADKASVTLEADRRDGCLSLSFNPPDSDPWDVTAAIQFARTP